VFVDGTEVGAVVETKRGRSTEWIAVGLTARLSHEDHLQEIGRARSKQTAARLLVGHTIPPKGTKQLGAPRPSSPGSGQTTA